MKRIILEFTEQDNGGSRLCIYEASEEPTIQELAHAANMRAVLVRLLGASDATPLPPEEKLQ